LLYYVLFATGFTCAFLALEYWYLNMRDCGNVRGHVVEANVVEKSEGNVYAKKDAAPPTKKKKGKIFVREDAAPHKY